MSRFKKLSVSDTPEVSTASLPDIVFMLLFFFMTVTIMKDVPLKVENELPSATQVKKLEKKDRIIYIYIGKPNQKYSGTLGGGAQIQLNDKFAKVSDIGPYVLEQLTKMPENIHGLVTVSLKVDKRANMGVIIDVKEELRRINMLKINYSTYKGEEVNR